MYVPTKSSYFHVHHEQHVSACCGTPFPFFFPAYPYPVYSIYATNFFYTTVNQHSGDSAHFWFWIDSMDDSHAATVKILTLFLLVISILGVGTRAITKAIISHASNLDDYLISISLVCFQRICAGCTRIGQYLIASSSLPSDSPLLSLFRQGRATEAHQYHPMILSWPSV